MSASDQKKTGINPVENAKYIEKTTKDFVCDPQYNRLPAFDNDPIFDDPLIGFARGEDSLFTEYKKIIGEFHLTPSEAYTAVLNERGIEADLSLPLSVISFILPATKATKLSLRNETTVPSVRWNNTRFQGQDFIDALSRHLVAAIESRGWHAAAPEIGKCFGFSANKSGICSNWSQRHIAYAAGLGTFSLNDGLITAKGIAMRCGSVVTDIPLTISKRPYTNHLSNCLFYRNGSCDRCIKRCPAGAITEKGHDKAKCTEYVYSGAQKELEKQSRMAGYIGPYTACGLCQVKVPCESMIPPDKIDVVE